jgi:hypothetical protein
MRYNSQSSLHDASFVMTSATSLGSHVASKGHSTAEILAVQDALDTASTVWDQIEETLCHVVANNQDIRESLETARSATRSLALNITELSEGDFEDDRRLLRENVHAFLKVRSCELTRKGHLLIFCCPIDNCSIVEYPQNPQQSTSCTSSAAV